MLRWSSVLNILYLSIFYVHHPGSLHRDVRSPARACVGVTSISLVLHRLWRFISRERGVVHFYPSANTDAQMQSVTFYSWAPAGRQFHFRAAPECGRTSDPRVRVTSPRLPTLPALRRDERRDYFAHQRLCGVLIAQLIRMCPFTVCIAVRSASLV